MPIEETENTITIRVNDPSDFQDTSFTTVVVDEEQGITALVGMLAGTNGPTTAIHSYMFQKDKGWTIDKASKWVSEQGETIKVSMDVIPFSLKTEDGEEIAKSLDFAILSKKEEGGDLVIEGIASSDAIDRDNEVAEISTMEIEDFKKNPILLFQHDQNKPIGKVVEIEKQKGEDGKMQLWVKAIIHSSTILGREIIKLVQNGVLRAFSFYGRAKRRVATGNGVKILRGLKLFEISVVSVPANQEALFQISKNYADYTDQVREEDVTAFIEMGLACTEQEAITIKALDMAVTDHTPTEEDTMSDKEEKATQSGGQDTKQDGPALPQEVIALLQDIKSEITSLSERVAALEGAGDTTASDETKAKVPAAAQTATPEPNLQVVEKGTKKSAVTGAKDRSSTKLDVKKMKAEERSEAKDAIERAWYKRNGHLLQERS